MIPLTVADFSLWIIYAGANGESIVSDYCNVSVEIIFRKISVKSGLFQKKIGREILHFLP